MRIVASIVIVTFLSATLGAHAYAAGAQDTTAPRVLHEVVPKGVIGQNLELKVRLQDQSDIFEPKVYFRRVGELEYNTIDLVKGPKDEWLGVIPATFVTRDIEYFLEAYDIMGNGPSRHGGPDRPHMVKIVTRIDPVPQQPRQVDSGQVTVRPIEGGTPPPPGVVQEKKEDSVTKKWWFWTIIGVLVAGAAAGAAVGIVYATKKDPGSENFNEVTVRISGTDPREGL